MAVYGRWFNLAVIVLWLATMTWLVKEKVLPPLLIGDPPSSRQILEARQNEPPVAWRLRWNHRPMGWALSVTEAQPDGSTQIRSRVHFDDLPVGDMTPGWLRGLCRLLDESRAKMETDTRSVLSIDPEGRLRRIRSTIEFKPIGEAVTMEGLVEESDIRLSVRSRELTYQTSIAIDPNTLMGDSLSPQTQLPGLREGQTWTVEVCSPLRYPNRPLEILQAKVQGTENLQWNDRDVATWLVEYHGNSGIDLGREKKPRGRLWVGLDGTVLKQELALFDSTMTFVRMTPDDAAALARQEGEEW
jgi:hypothetical protein